MLSSRLLLNEKIIAKDSAGKGIGLKRWVCKILTGCQGRVEEEQLTNASTTHKACGSQRHLTAALSCIWRAGGGRKSCVSHGLVTTAAPRAALRLVTCIGRGHRQRWRPIGWWKENTRGVARRVSGSFDWQPERPLGIESRHGCPRVWANGDWASVSPSRLSWRVSNCGARARSLAISENGSEARELGDGVCRSSSAAARCDPSPTTERINK